jgi:hypothetical protein
MVDRMAGGRELYIEAGIQAVEAPGLNETLVEMPARVLSDERSHDERLPTPASRGNIRGERHPLKVHDIVPAPRHLRKGILLEVLSENHLGLHDGREAGEQGSEGKEQKKEVAKALLAVGYLLLARKRDVLLSI